MTDFCKCIIGVTQNKFFMENLKNQEVVSKLDISLVNKVSYFSPQEHLIILHKY